MLIDGPDFRATAAALGFDVDLRRLRSLFEKQGKVVRAAYYTVMAEDRECSPARPPVEWISHNGFRVVERHASDPPRINADRGRTGSVRSSLVVDALQLTNQIDRLVLCSGNGDFQPVVDAMQRHGVQATVMSTMASRPPMIASRLRRQANAFVDLLDLKPLIERGGP